MLNRGSGAKTIWRLRKPKILPLMNGRLIRLHGFTRAKFMLICVPEWKVMHGEAQEVMPDITHRAMQEAKQGIDWRI